MLPCRELGIEFSGELFEGYVASRSVGGLEEGSGRFAVAFVGLGGDVNPGFFLLHCDEPVRVAGVE